MDSFRRSALFASFLAFSACANNHGVEVFPSVGAGQLRFRDPASIVAAKPDTSRFLEPAFPKYPRSFDGISISGTVVEALVIDTTGHVELSTVSFLQPDRSEFTHSVCASLQKVRFAPISIQGTKRRALIIQVHAFVGPGAGSDEAGLPAAAALRDRAEDEFLRQPIETTIAKLEPLPHCDTIRP